MKNKYLFYLTATFFSFSFFYVASNAQAANPSCHGGYCVDTEVICGVHSVTIQDYISPGLIGMENVSCYEINGHTQSGAYSYSWSNMSGGYGVFNSIHCSGSGPLAGIKIYDSSSCYVKPGSLGASIEGPSQFSSNDSGVKFTFQAYYSDLSLDSGVSLDYKFDGGGVAIATQGSTKGSKTEVKGLGGCPSAPTDCEYRGNKYQGNTCCVSNYCYDPVCYQSGTQYYCFNYITQQYDKMGSCSLTCNKNYTLTSTAIGGYDSKIFSKKVRYTCPKPPTLSSNNCGTASGNIYSIATAYWPVSDTFCTGGSPLGSNPLFPTPGTTVSWDCSDQLGCSASRLASLVTLDGELVSLPPSGNAPFNPKLTVKKTGSATGSLTFKFDCTNDGIFERTFIVTNPSFTQSQTYTGCYYNNSGTYTAMVEITQNGKSIRRTASVQAREGGKCGLAARTYDFSETNYSGSFCNPGFLTNISKDNNGDNEPDFPSSGSSVKWKCINDGSKSDWCEADKTSGGASNWIETDIYR
jgi:hypothetical protein